jgi:hypothetical protein
VVSQAFNRLRDLLLRRTFVGADHNGNRYYKWVSPLSWFQAVHQLHHSSTCSCCSSSSSDRIHDTNIRDALQMYRAFVCMQSCCLHAIVLIQQLQP